MKGRWATARSCQPQGAQIAISDKCTCSCYNITMQKPCQGVTMAISILFAEATNDTNKKAAISSILRKATIVIEFPGKCY